MAKLVQSHLKGEEEVLSEEAIRKHFTEEEAKATTKKIAKMSRGHSKDPSVALSFMVHSMDEKERAIFLKKMPWIVRKLIVPKVCDKKTRKMGIMPLMKYP